MSRTTSETSALVEVIKDQNLMISSLRQTIEALNIDSKILREQIDYLTKKHLEQRAKRQW